MIAVNSIFGRKRTAVLGQTANLKAVSLSLSCVRGISAAYDSDNSDLPTLEDLFAAVQTMTESDCNRLIYKGHTQYGYTLSAIAQIAGLHDSTVSKIGDTRANSQFKTCPHPPLNKSDDSPSSSLSSPFFLDHSTPEAIEEQVGFCE
jgi:hypothetical protein